MPKSASANCTRNRLVAGFVAAYSAPHPDPLAGCTGWGGKEGEREGQEGGKKGEGRMEGKGAAWVEGRLLKVGAYASNC